MGVQKKNYVYAYFMLFKRENAKKKRPKLVKIVVD